MTKQVFDQIAEGLREAAETPPAWALRMGRTIADKHAKSDDLDETGYTWCALEIARALAEADKAATERERERWNSMPKSWELSCENDDSSDLSTDLVWKVHAVHGGLNDREWSLLGKGDTPSNAIDAAFIAAASEKYHGEAAQ